MAETFDYIVIGAGSAGCVLANRLSMDPSARVLLLEAGPEPRSPWIRIPGAVSRLFTPGPYTLGYATEPEPHLHERRIYWPRGRGLGGSSTINGMLYMRGHPRDYDHWRELGNPGWGWEDVLPLFKRFERRPGGDPEVHGTDGELSVSDAVMRHPFARRFVEAALEAGFPYNEDFNSGSQDGVGYLQYTIRNGLRCSSYDAFIAPIRHRRNLAVLTKARVEKIHLDARRATGVSYLRGSDRVTANAKREVILTAGTINSPQLLMVSGIGPQDHLKEVGIDVVHDLPSVGRSLHDHAYASLVYDAPRRYSMNHRARGVWLGVEVARYALLRKGLLALGVTHNCLYARVRDGVDQPDIQITTRPYSFTFESGNILLDRTPSVTASVCLLRPESRGELTLRSPNIAEAPRLRANYLASARDQETMIAGLRLAAKIMGTPKLAAMQPRTPLAEGDEAVLETLRGLAGSVMHPVGTCRMGSDMDSVVDPRLRVRGIEALRVADASIMPSIVSGNTNAPTMMIAEKAADFVREDRSAAG